MKETGTLSVRQVVSVCLFTQNSIRGLDLHLLVLKSPGAILLKLGSVTVRWYGIMIACGFLAAAHFAGRLATRWGLDAEKMVNLSLTSFLGGVLGARLYFVALNLPSYLERPQDILATWLGGMSIHGGIIGGLLTGIIAAKKMQLQNIRRYADVFGVVVPLGQAVGRWGNFFNSEAFGLPVLPGFPVALYIPADMRPEKYASSEYFHAAFLYESIWDLGIFLALYFWGADRLKKYPGVCFLVYIALYSIGRLLIEPIRTDSIMAGAMPVPIAASAATLVGALMLIPFMVVKAKAEQQLVALSDGHDEAGAQSSESFSSASANSDNTNPKSASANNDVSENRS